MPKNTDPPSAAAGKLLEEARMGLHFTRKRLAGLVGVSDAYLFDVERGRRVPSEATIRRLCLHLALDPDAVIAACGRAPQVLIDELVGRESIREVLYTLADMSDEQVGKVLGFARKSMVL